MSDVVVRRCYSCGEPSMVVVRDWAETTMGIHTGASAQKDWVCQSCGQRLVQRSRLGSIVFAVVLGPFLLCMAPLGTVIAGLAEGSWWLPPIGLAVFAIGAVFVWFAARPVVRMMRSPIQKGAPPPLMQFADSEPARRCTCGGVALCTKVVQQRANGMPMGVEETYVCQSCGKEFEIESAMGSVTSIVGGVAFSAIAIGCHYATGEWDWLTIVVTVVAGLLGVGGFFIAIARFMARVRHPVIEVGRAA